MARHARSEDGENDIRIRARLESTMNSMKDRTEIPSGVRGVVTDDGATLMDVKSGLIYALNATGGRIWHELMEGRNKEEIATALSTKLNVRRDQVLNDLDIFFTQLAEKGLLRLK